MVGEWLLLGYTLPRDPSRTRVSLWRKLKKVGAVNLQQSVWLLPDSKENFALFGEIKKEVQRNSGEAFVMKTTTDQNEQASFIARFHEARNEEYRELLEQCGEFFKELDKETARENFTFAEVEENEEELSKLRQWYGKIKTRDTFGAPLEAQAGRMLEKCEKALAVFCERVYENHEKER
jgi:hypothetical protein